MRVSSGLDTLGYTDSISEDPTITGLNVGINDGSSAGQTIFHCHIHLIPRRDGDVENPRGGVWHTIPGRGDYPKKF